MDKQLLACVPEAMAFVEKGLMSGSALSRRFQPATTPSCFEAGARDPGQTGLMPN